MFDEKLKQAYKNITPSSELEHKILEMSKRPMTSGRSKVLSLKPIMTLAACFVLLLGSVTVIHQMTRGVPADILLQGNMAPSAVPMTFTPEIVDYVIPTAPRAATAEPVAHAQWALGAAIDLQISCESEITLTVDEGILYMLSVEDEAENVAAVGQSLSMTEGRGEITVRWVVPITEQDCEYHMVAGDETICVNYHAQTNEYSISRTDADR